MSRFQCWDNGLRDLLSIESYLMSAYCWDITALMFTKFLISLKSSCQPVSYSRQKHNQPIFSPINPFAGPTWAPSLFWLAHFNVILCWRWQKFGVNLRFYGVPNMWPVSRKSRNFSGAFRVTCFSLYLQNEGASRHETLQLFQLFILFTTYEKNGFTE